MKTNPYRVAVRAEGEFINLYWARTDTMEGAIFVASLMKTLCEEEPEMFEMYKLLAQGIGRHLARRVTGQEVVSVILKDAVTGKAI